MLDLLSINGEVNLIPSFLFSSRKKSAAFLRLIREATCYFQGHFTDYSLVASSMHKRIRLCDEKGLDNLDELYEHTNNLVNHCNLKLDTAFRKTAEFLHRYFEVDNRHKCKPRICVKTSFNGKIKDLFRDYGAIRSDSFLAVHNTGFDSVIKDGKQFICNNIPKEAIKGSYVNLRLNSNLAGKYELPNWYKRTRSRFSDDDSCTDEEWEKCWDVNRNNRDPTPNPGTCYKSTLIIPMTLRGADAGQELRKILQMDTAYEKSTFGYLCFDHRTTGFFRDKEDIDVGYFFADLLSLYMVNRQNYIHNSDTFKTVWKKLSKAGRIGNGAPPFLEEE
jgi:hypothetical protein